jgi:hypothetical protein
MLQHVEQGQRTEIANLNAALVTEARLLGLAVPLNEAIVALIRGLEARNARAASFDPAECESLANKELAGETRPANGSIDGGSP